MLLELQGGLGSGINEGSHIVPRREFNEFAPLRLETLHCYGVDFLSTKDVLELLAEFEPQQVEWLDDSSCNVVFNDASVPPQVVEKLGCVDSQLEHPWTMTKPLHPKQKVKGMPLKAPRSLKLQLRLATDADVKDPGHSGHTDSVYYATVKEQQAIQRQRAELGQSKKKRRQSRLPPPTAMSQDKEDRTSEAGSAAAADSHIATQCEEARGPRPDSETNNESSDSRPSALRLGRKNLMDPLLYLCMPGAGGEMAASSPSTTASGPLSDMSAAASSQSSPREDLLTMVQRNEAEYVAIPGFSGASSQSQPSRGRARSGGPHDRRQDLDVPMGSQPASSSKPGNPRRRGGSVGPQASRGRQHGKGEQQQADAARSRTAREATPGRGRKRRAANQEPKPVASATVPRRKPEALPEVEAFLKENTARCQRFVLKRTFRSIIYASQNRVKRSKAGGESEQAKPEAGSGKMETATDSQQKKKQQEEEECKDLPPWDQYLRLNAHFSRHGHFMHTVAWQVDGKWVLTIVPHLMRVDPERLARAMQKPVSAVRQCKLKEIERLTGFPAFVCPPVGYKRGADGQLPVMLVDSSVLELRKPLLFDCGTVGLCMKASELLRITKASPVEQLVINAQEASAATAKVAATATTSAVAAAQSQEQASVGGDDVKMLS